MKKKKSRDTVPLKGLGRQIEFNYFDNYGSSNSF